MKKVLILTLGVGNIFGKEKENASKTPIEQEQWIRDMVEQEQYPYETTSYVVEIEGEQDVKNVSTEYVAEIQIDKFQPDMVIVIGTVKSGWSMFYRKFTKNSTLDKETLTTDVLRLYHIEKENGKDTDNPRLKELEQEIQQIYEDKLVFSENKPVDVKVCLIRYGINSDELLENYQNISEIEHYLDKNEEYEVAFDITHSFRSLPIYNLVLLNYLKQVSSYNMKISHIFYGNFDVRQENGGNAPLVDLADISKILDLTNGVSEFKNTGNATCLIQTLPENEKKLMLALEKFDWATQVNDRHHVIEAIQELSDVLHETFEVQNMYTDAKIMLKAMLGQEENNLFRILDCANKGEAQLLLAKWYQRQNRYGLAVTTACEALRSFLVPYYLQWKDKGQEKCEDEICRKEAIQRLDVIQKKKEKWIQTEITDFLVELEILRNSKIKFIRNTFAHNLLSQQSLDEAESKDAIDTFIEMLDKLHDYINHNETEFKKVYFYVPPIPEIERRMNQNVRVFISEEYDTFEDYQKLVGKEGSEYLVYKLSNRIIGNPKTDSQKILDRGSLICEYLNLYFEKETVQIVLDGRMSEKKKENYAMLLMHENFVHVFRLEDGRLMPAAKAVFQISYECKTPWDEVLYAIEPEQYII